MKRDFHIMEQDGLNTLVSYTGTDAELSLPESIECIGRNAFLKCHSLRSIRFPASLKYVETEAFHCCDRLEHIHFSEGLLEIRRRAFWYCSSLRSLSLIS